jgi:hypothetical protein
MKSVINLRVTDVQARDSIQALILHMFPEGNCTRKTPGEYITEPVSPWFRSKLLSSLYQHLANGRSGFSVIMKSVMHQDYEV